MGENLHFRMKDLPRDERPREKLIRSGPEFLSNAELLAIILRTGTKKQTAIHLAEELLSTLDGLRGLINVSAEELMMITGIGQVKAAQLIALVELTKRVQASFSFKRKINSAHDLAEILIPQMRFLPTEVFKVILLNSHNQIIAIQEISRGSLTETVVHPREVFREAVRRGCSALIVTHNHPNGDPEPSVQDLELTQKLVAASDILGIQVLDHLIIGDGQYTSFKERGII